MGSLKMTKVTLQVYDQEYWAGNIAISRSLSDPCCVCARTRIILQGPDEKRDGAGLSLYTPSPQTNTSLTRDI